MIIKQIKLTNVSKDRLGRLKGKTGIKNWNVLCRWALCYSLSENTMPTDIQIVAECLGIPSVASIVIYMMRL